MKPKAIITEDGIYIPLSAVSKLEVITNYNDDCKFYTGFILMNDEHIFNYDDESNEDLLYERLTEVIEELYEIIR